LFPHFAAYKGRWGRQSVDGVTAENAKRIFHPRCFRQYFLLKVPSELFSQRDFDVFLSSILNATEERARDEFDDTFRSIV
jgi:hypothetical protein